MLQSIYLHISISIFIVSNLKNILAHQTRQIEVKLSLTRFQWLIVQRCLKNKAKYLLLPFPFFSSVDIVFLEFLAV